MRMQVAAWTFAGVLASVPAFAQHAHPSLLAVDSTIGSDVTSAQGAGPIADGNHVTGVFIDSLISADLGRGIQAMVRPQVQRLGASGEWNRQIWIADVRYEHP